MLISLDAPAKVNLYLRVIDRRPDSYHNIDSVMLKLGLADRLSFSMGKDGIELCCSDPSLPLGSDNLVYRAASLFYAHYQIKPALKIELEKNIPVAAGLGGGSSDAAAVLRALSVIHKIDTGQEALFDLAVKLGADVPFFLQEQVAARARGVGERLSAFSLPGAVDSILLVNPGFDVSTRWVYESYAEKRLAGAQGLGLTKQPDPDILCGYLMQGGLVGGALVNDLELVTLSRYPELVKIKERFFDFGALAALMAGSGPTMFAVFAKKDTAEACRASMAEDYPFVCLTEQYGRRCDC